jgi:hypothetical protein
MHSPITSSPLRPVRIHPSSLLTSFYLFHPQSNCTYSIFVPHHLITSFYSFNARANSCIFTFSLITSFHVFTLRPLIRIQSSFTSPNIILPFPPSVQLYLSLPPHHLITSFYSFNPQAKSYIPRSPKSTISPLRPICIHPSSLLTLFYVFPHQLFNYSPLTSINTK